MPTTIAGYAGDVHAILRDMRWTGNERAIAHCEQRTRPTLDQISQDWETSVRGYRMLRPSQVGDLHRGLPTPRTATLIHHDYTGTDNEGTYGILQNDHTAYIRKYRAAGDIAAA